MELLATRGVAAPSLDAFKEGIGQIYGQEKPVQSPFKGIRARRHILWPGVPQAKYTMGKETF